jgi:CHAD domain-containing protein
MAQRPRRTYSLLAEESATEGMRRIALGRAEKAAERLREAMALEDPSDCIHGARKDLKKLRAVLRLLRSELGDDLHRAENDRYREAGRLLSPTRDATVKLETLDALRERFTERLPAGATAEWREALRAERDRAVAEVHGGDESLERALAAIEAGRERIATWPLRTDSWKLVAPGIARAYRRGRKAMRVAAEEPSDERLHEWRKRVKDLWYHLRILREARPERLAPMLDRADELADVLGVHHDLAVLRADLLRRELPTTPRPALVEAIAERQRELAAHAFELGGQLYEIKPKAFRRKMKRGWKAWRAGV